MAPAQPRTRGQTARALQAAGPGAQDAAVPTTSPCAAPPPRRPAQPSASLGPTHPAAGRKRRARCFGRSGSAAQANSGRAALPRLLRGAARAAHWPLFIAHSFHWSAPRGGAAALSAAHRPRPPPLPASHLEGPFAGSPRSPPTPPGTGPEHRSQNPRPLDILAFPATLPPGGKLRQESHGYLGTFGLICIPAAAFPRPGTVPAVARGRARQSRATAASPASPHPPGPSWFGAADLPQGARRHLRGGLGAERRRAEGAAWLRPSLAAPAVP